MFAGDDHAGLLEENLAADGGAVLGEGPARRPSRVRPIADRDRTREADGRPPAFDWPWLEAGYLACADRLKP